MKIVDRETFLTLPPGTVFFGADGYGNPYRHLSIKVEDVVRPECEDINEDHEYTDTYAVLAGAHEFGDRAKYMDTPFPCAAIWEPIEVYSRGNVIVFEADDVRKLIDLLTEALKMTGGEAAGTYTAEQLAEMVAQNGVEAEPFAKLVIAARKRLGLESEKAEEPKPRSAVSLIIEDLFGKARP